MLDFFDKVWYNKKVDYFNAPIKRGGDRMSSSKVTRVVKFVNLAAHTHQSYSEDERDNLLHCQENRQKLAHFLKNKMDEKEASAILKYFFGGFEIGEVECPFEGKELAAVAREVARKVDFVFVYMLLVVKPGEARQRLNELSSTLMREQLRECVDDLLEAYYIAEYFPECNEFASRFNVLQATASAVLNQLQVALDLLKE